MIREIRLEMFQQCEPALEELVHDGDAERVQEHLEGFLCVVVEAQAKGFEIRNEHFVSEFIAAEVVQRQLDDASENGTTDFLIGHAVFKQTV